MTYYFDDYGWLSETPVEGRETNVAPPEIPVGLEANFNGIYWVIAKRLPPPVPPTQEEILAEKKAARASEVSSISVTTASGNSFDGNEQAQDRMARAIAALDDGESTMWVLADSSVASVTKAELREALRLAGSAMTAIWLRPYQ